MKKSLVAVLLVGLAGVAVAGVGVHRLANGCCPLTGEQIGRRGSDETCPVSAPAASAPSQAAAGSAGLANFAASGAASEFVAAEAAGCPLEQCKDQPLCPSEQRKRCCGQKPDCESEEQKSEPAAKPAEEKP